MTKKELQFNYDILLKSYDYIASALPELAKCLIENRPTSALRLLLEVAEETETELF